MIALQLRTDEFAIRSNFELLQRLVPDTGDRTIALRFGVASVGWPGGAATSNSVAVTHNLGSTPQVVIATLQNGGGAQFSAVAAFTYGATTFNVQLMTVDGSTPLNTVTSTVAWIAIG